MANNQVINFKLSPQEAWSDRELRRWFRDLHIRAKWGTFQVSRSGVEANATTDQTITAAAQPILTGLRVGMYVHVSPPPTLDAGLVVGGAWVAADDSITIRLGNLTTGAIGSWEGDAETWAFWGFLNST